MSLTESTFSKNKKQNNRTLIKEDNKELDAEYVEVFVPVSILFLFFLYKVYRAPRYYSKNIFYMKFFIISQTSLTFFSGFTWF